MNINLISFFNFTVWNQTVYHMQSLSYKPKSKSSESHKLKYIYDCQVADSLCATCSLSYPKYLLTAFVICARWTGDIYYPHIKLSDCPYVRISLIAIQLMSSSLFRI